MTQWTAPPRTAEALQIYGTAESDRAAHPENYRLGADVADAVVEKASRGQGEDVFGDPADWKPGLAQYLDSAAEDGRLNALGAMTVRKTAVGRLVARLRMAQYLREHPDVEQRQLTPPIFITGGWRTGTTFLFRLMDRDPRLRAPLPAELGVPWKLAGDLEPGGRADRLEAMTAGPNLLHVLNPTMAAVHDSGPTLAEECVLGLGTTLRNWGFTSTTRLDGYARWLAGESLAEEYRQHRRMLQILDMSDGRRWVLKAPAHTAELGHLIASYPGAVVVHLHRDIVETVASGASLFATFRSTYSDDVDGVDVGRFQTEQTELWLRRAVAARASDAADTVTWVDVQYTDLVADPASVLERIYAAAGLDAPDAASMIEQHRRAQPRNGKGHHRYSAEQFGIDADVVRERMRFYTETFLPTG